MPEPGQRRFNFLIVGLMLLLVCALIAGLVVYNHVHSERAAQAQAVADVRAAYFDYYAALSRSFEDLNPSELRAYVTDAGYSQEMPDLNRAIQLGNRVRLSVRHQLQVVVYKDGKHASVDDIIVRHIVPLLATLAPAGPDRIDTVHQSFLLIKRGSHWLVDSVFAFGFADPQIGQLTSYAARGSFFSPSTEAQIMGNYLFLWEIRDQTSADLNPAELGRVEVNPELSLSQTSIRAARSTGRGVQTISEHNVRLGMESSGTAWAYDTVFLTNVAVSIPSGKRLGSTYTQVVRWAFRLRKVGETWKADYDVVEQ